MLPFSSLAFPLKTFMSQEIRLELNLFWLGTVNWSKVNRLIHCAPLMTLKSNSCIFNKQTTLK